MSEQTPEPAQVGAIITGHDFHADGPVNIQTTHPPVLGLVLMHDGQLSVFGKRVDAAPAILRDLADIVERAQSAEVDATAAALLADAAGAAGMARETDADGAVWLVDQDGHRYGPFTQAGAAVAAAPSPDPEPDVCGLGCALLPGHDGDHDPEPPEVRQIPWPAGLGGTVLDNGLTLVDPEPGDVLGAASLPTGQLPAPRRSPEQCPNHGPGLLCPDCTT